MKQSKNLFLVLLFTIVTISETFAQASLAAENVIEDIKVTTKTGQKVYAVCRDAVNKNQWYYFPNELRVAEEIGKNGKTRPKITILRYQYQDAITKESKDGGVLVASFTYAIEPEAVDNLKAQIKKRKKVDNITISSIPLNDANIEFLADNEAFIGKTNAKTSSAGATSASQEMIICFDLTVLGASVMKALASGAGGIPIRANISYNGLTPPCGFKISGKWSDVYDFYEQNKTKEGKTGFSLGPIGFGGSYAKTTQKVKESLETMKGVKVEAIECQVSQVGTSTTGPPVEGASSGAPQTDGAALATTQTDGSSNAEPKAVSFDGGIEEVLTFINTAVFGAAAINKSKELQTLQSQLKATNDPAYIAKLTAMISTAKIGVEAAYKNSTASINRKQTGAINYDRRTQKIVIRKSTFGGLLSFRRFFPNGITDEQMKKEGFLIDIDANEVPYVIIGLPNLNPDYDLNSMIIDVSYKNGKGNTISEARRWDAGKGWLTVTGKEVGYIRFNLIGETDKKRIEEPEFIVKMSVISKIPNASFEIIKTAKLTRGDKYIDALELCTNQYTFDGSLLDFSKITQNPDDLGYAKVEMATGNFKISKDLKPFFTSGAAGPPNTVYLLTPKVEAPITSKVTYLTNKGQKTEKVNSIVLGDNTLINDWKVQ